MTARVAPAPRPWLRPWLAATAIAAAFVGIEWALTGDAGAALDGIAQPGWALPIWGWALVAAAFYGIMAWVLKEHLARPHRWRATALALSAAILAINAGWNVVLLDWQRFDLAAAILAPYAALVAVLVRLTWPVHRAAASLLGGYLLFLPYDAAWAWALWTLRG